MTAPRQTTASKPAAAVASVWATSGSSKAPGTHATVTSVRSTPASRSAARHPSSSRIEMPPLNLAHATAMRSPLPSWDPSSAVPTSRAVRATSAGSRSVSAADAIESLEQVAHAIALRAQVREVVLRRRALQGDALGDVQPEALEAAELVGIVRHEAHGRDPEVDEDLRADAVFARLGSEPELEVGVHGVAPVLLERVGADLVP